MTAQDQQLRFQTARYLHNDLPGIAHAQDRADRHPLRMEGRHVQTAPKDPLRWCGIKSTVPEIYHFDERPRCIEAK
jgi:hypothetical protein